MQVFGRLTVDFVEGSKAHCTCACGTKRIVSIYSLRSGNTRSCGCLARERNNTNGNYEPSNCRWATQVEQTRNRRITATLEIDGRTRVLGEVCAERGVSAHLVHCRLRSGWPVNDRLFMPSLRTSLGA